MPIDVKALGSELAAVVAAQMRPLHRQILELKGQVESLETAKRDLEKRLDAMPDITREVNKASDECEIRIVNKFTSSDVINGWFSSSRFSDAVKAVAAKDRAENPEITEKSIDEIAQRAAAMIPVPQDGKSVTMDEVRPVIDLAVKEIRDAAASEISSAVASIPSPKDGEDGTSVTLSDIQPLLHEAIKSIREDAMSSVGDAVSLIPTPRDGADCDMESVKYILSDGIKSVRSECMAAVESAVKSIPLPKDGKDGDDGVGLAGCMIDRNGCLIVTMTNGGTRDLGVVVGRDGNDGLSMSEIVRQYDAAKHEIVERWVVGAEHKELRYPAGGISHGGYWREGTNAVAGQTWTHAGTVWIAKNNTSEKPARDSGDWHIFASKGRDGRDAFDKKPDDPINLKKKDD